MQKLFKSQENKKSFKESKILIAANPRNRAWIEVDPKAIESNTVAIKKRLEKECLLMAVVKADGYGHGAETVAKAAIKGGANNLGVATLQEGIELREKGIKCPILVLGNLIDKLELEACLHWNLMPTISDYREGLICENIAKQANKVFQVQVKFDTGMTRLGCKLENTCELIESIIKSKNLLIKGIYSHLALADKMEERYPLEFTKIQRDRFECVLNKIRKRKICCHLANSAGTIIDKGLHFNMVRVGLAIYGYNPIQNHSQKLKLKPALSVKARITLVREVPKGIGISYGHEFITQRESRLGVVSIGYADGINRSLSGKISVICKGQCIPQVGAITMDQMIIDITDFPEISPGSVVTLLGTEGKLQVTAYEWGELSDSILWEVLCGFKNRLPRVVI